MSESTKQSIPYGDYLTLCGLLSLAKRHSAMLNDIVEQCEAITGETDPDVSGLGHCADMCYADNPSANDLLARLEVAIEGHPLRQHPQKQTEETKL